MHTNHIASFMLISAVSQVLPAEVQQDIACVILKKAVNDDTIIKDLPSGSYEFRIYTSNKFYSNMADPIIECIGQDNFIRYYLYDMKSEVFKSIKRIVKKSRFSIQHNAEIFRFSHATLAGYIKESFE